MVLDNKANTFKVIGLFVLIFLLFAQPTTAKQVPSFDCGAQPDMLDNECWALVALYNSTYNLLDPWVYDTGWLGNPNPCQWFGVTCNASPDANVISLILPGNNLSGPLPPEIGDFPLIIDLNLGGNSLTGSLPPEVGDLSSLINLNLSSNNLDGTLPPEIGNFPAMTDLNLSGNNFTGSFPAEVQSLVFLHTLNIAVNGFSGNLPSEIGSLSFLETLDIGNNSFDGEIPGSFINLTNIAYIDTTNNDDLCMPDDADLQTWYNRIETKLGSLSPCFVPDTETPTPVPNTLTPTPIPLPTNTPTATNTPTITPTPTMLGPFQTLTAFAYEDTLTATANWFRTPSPEATATRYYILVSQTLIPGGEDQQGPQVDGGQGSDLPIPGEDGGTSSLWWLLLIIPIGLIGAGIFLELRGRRSQASDSSSESSSNEDNDDEGFQTFL